MPNPFRLSRLLLVLAASGLFAGHSLAAEAPGKITGKPIAAPASEGLDGVTLYQYMLAEIAAGRGEYGIAAQAYLEMAKRVHHPVISRRATELAIQAKQGGWAIEAAQLWSAEEPGSVQALQMLAVLQANSGGKIEDLEQTLLRLFIANPEARVGMLLQLQRMYTGFPDKQAVATSVVHVTEPYVVMPEAHFARAQAYFAADQRVQAEASARQALALRPDWEPAAILIVRVAPPDRAVAAMEELGEFGRKYPQARDARLSYLRWLAANGRAAEARANYTQLLSEFPSDDDLAFMVVQVAVSQGDHETAEPLVRRLIAARHRESDALRVQLGQELELQGRLPEAQAAYEAVAPGRSYVAARNALATLLAKQGRLAEGRGVLTQAAVTMPDQAPVLLRAEAELLVNQRMLPEAFDLLEARLAAQPEEIETLYQAGMLAERLDRLDLMEARLRQVIKLKPDHAHAYNALGYTFADRNIRLDEAEQLLLRAHSLAAEDAAILDSVGWLYFRKGDFPRAVEYLRKSYAQMPDQEVAAHLVEALWAQGQQDEARSLLSKARQSNPKSELLNKLATRLGQ